MNINAQEPDIELLSEDLKQDALKKSIRLSQAGRMNLIADQVAGLEESRRTNKRYHEFSEAAMQSRLEATGVTMPDDDDGVNMSLGDTVNHNYPPPTQPQPVQQTSKTSTALAATVGGLLATTVLGPIAAVGLYSGLTEKPVPVQQPVVQEFDPADFQILHYDENGNIVKVPYIGPHD